MKKLMIGLISLMFATVLTAAPYNTNIALWKGTVASPVTYIDETGNIIAPAFGGDGSGLTDLDGANLQAGSVTASRLDSGIITNVLSAGMVLPAVDGSAVTNMSGDEIKSGDIDAARMTANAVVVGDFSADREVLAGTGAGTFESFLGKTIIFTNKSSIQTSVWYIRSGYVTNIALNP